MSYISDKRANIQHIQGTLKTVYQTNQPNLKMGVNPNREFSKQVAQMVEKDLNAHHP